MSYDSDVINATSGRGEANWDLIIKLCNRIRDSVGPTSMAQAMGSVLKRVKHSDPNIQLHALTLLEACVSNCGKTFQSELTKSAFQTDFKSIITGSYADPRVTQRCKDLLASWANEFKSDTNMSGLVRFVEQLRKDGISFQGLQQTSSPAAPSQPAASSNEDEDLRRAIQMSLRDTNPTPAVTTSLYPSMPTRSSPSPTPTRSKVVKKVRAIYDFEAAEDNELSFRAGEVVTLLDDSDENWWRGETQLGTGLFPASFVSTNLSVDPEPSQHEAKSKKKGKNGHKSKSSKTKGSGGVKVNSDKISLLLDMIKEADVTSQENLAENETLVELEEECKKMRPVVEERMAALQRKEDEMKTINQKFEEALAMYRKILAEGPRLTSTLAAQQQATPTPGPVLNQQYPSSQYSASLSLQQPPVLSEPNPPPYFPTPPSSSQSSVSDGHDSLASSSQPSLSQPPPSMQYHGNMVTDQLPSIAPSLYQQPLQQPLQQPASLYTQPLQQQSLNTQPLQQQSLSTHHPPPPSVSPYAQTQVTQGPPQMEPPPPGYHPHASLYQPVHQPLL